MWVTCGDESKKYEGYGARTKYRHFACDILNAISFKEKYCFDENYSFVAEEVMIVGSWTDLVPIRHFLNDDPIHWRI